MNVQYREYLILAAVFIAILVFVYVHIVADLPDDFLKRVRKGIKEKKGADRGGIRDNR